MELQHYRVTGLREQLRLVWFENNVDVDVDVNYIDSQSQP